MRPSSETTTEWQSGARGVSRIIIRSVINKLPPQNITSSRTRQGEGVMENTLRFGDEILIRYSGYGKKKGTMAQGSEGTSTTADLNLGCIVGMG